MESMAKVPARKHAAFFATLASLSAAAALVIGCETEPTAPANPYEPGAKIALTAPKGGDKVQVGDTVLVKWLTKGAEVTEVDVRLSPDGGNIWVYLPHYNGAVGSTFRTDDEWGKFKWVVTDTIDAFGIKFPLVNHSVLLRVEQYSTSDSSLMAWTKSSISVLP
jgi:hypothetical protein